MSDLLRWKPELDKHEWWARDGGMSTPDNSVWVFGDSPVYQDAGGHAGPLRRITFGSTWTKNGKEKGQFPKVNGAHIGERRWPTGVCLFGGSPLVTFARVRCGAGFEVIGYGWSYVGIVHLRDEIEIWGSPRVVNGRVWVSRNTQWPDTRLVQRLLKGGPETVLPGLGWSLEVNIQWGPNVSYATRTGSPTWEIWRSYDRETWQQIGGVQATAGSMTCWPHATPWGCLVTWWEGDRAHLVRTLV